MVPRGRDGGRVSYYTSRGDTPFTSQVSGYNYVGKHSFQAPRPLGRRTSVHDPRDPSSDTWNWTETFEGVKVSSLTYKSHESNFQFSSDMCRITVVSNI